MKDISHTGNPFCQCVRFKSAFVLYLRREMTSRLSRGKTLSCLILTTSTFVHIMKYSRLDVQVSFLGHVNAEASAASPGAQEEGAHKDAQHNVPQALQPARADINTLHTWTDHPVVNRKTKSTRQFLRGNQSFRDVFS